MRTEVIFHEVGPDELYDVLDAVLNGTFERVGSGFTVRAFKNNVRQVRDTAQMLEFLAGLTERRRIENRHCPADDRPVGDDGLCPNTNCIYSQPRAGHPFGVFT